VLLRLGAHGCNDIVHRSYFVLFHQRYWKGFFPTSGQALEFFPRRILLMRREFPMGSHNLLFGYRFLSCSDPKLNLGRRLRVPETLRSGMDRAAVLICVAQGTDRD
jgi:hypothetical protein